MAWISFGALPCRKKKLWQLASRCCWNRARPWHASELLSFLVGIRTYQQTGRSSLKLILKLLLHVSLFLHHPQGAYMVCRLKLCIIGLIKYRVIENDCRGFNNLSYTIHLVLQLQLHVISFYGVTSRIRFVFVLFLQVSRNWRLLHATNSLERTRLSCWCL